MWCSRQVTEYRTKFVISVSLFFNKFLFKNHRRVNAIKFDKEIAQALTFLNSWPLHLTKTNLSLTQFNPMRVSLHMKRLYRFSIFLNLI